VVLSLASLSASQVTLFFWQLELLYVKGWFGLIKIHLTNQEPDMVSYWFSSHNKKQSNEGQISGRGKGGCISEHFIYTQM